MIALKFLQADTSLLVHQALALALQGLVPMSIDLGTRSTTTSLNGAARPKKPLKHICFADIDGKSENYQQHSTLLQVDTL